MNKHTPDIEDIVETVWNDAKDQENDWFYGMSIEHRQLFHNWLRTTLQSQADQYEREKAQIFWQGYEAGNDYQTHRDNLDKEDLTTIREKYGVDLSE